MFWRTFLYIACIGAAGLFVFLPGPNHAPTIQAIQAYQPAIGDVIFQSLPRSRLVTAIEGVTESPYSHCGIVVQRNGYWFVLEAYRCVEFTPLDAFILRGRNGGFVVYRPTEEYQQIMPEIIRCAIQYLGRPYDIRYQMDDEKIYCSELIYKSFKDATGDEFGELIRFGDMNWEPYRATIEYINGSVPLNRRIITPKNLAGAKQLQRVFSHNLE